MNRSLSRAAWQYRRYLFAQYPRADFASTRGAAFKEDPQKYLRTQRVGGSSELVRDYSSMSRSLSYSVVVPRTPLGDRSMS